MRDSTTLREKLSRHFTFWDFDSNTSMVPVLLQNMNAAFAVVSVTMPVSISLCLSINYFVVSDNHINSAMGILTNTLAFIFCFLFSGKTHLFKSFSALQAYFVMLIVARFGTSVIPWISVILGLMMMLATLLKFQNIIDLIPSSITIALKNSIGILIIINELVHAFGIHDHPPNVRLFDAIEYLMTHKEEARFFQFIIFLVITLSLFTLVKKARNLPWFLVFTLLSILAGFIFQKYKDLMTIAIPFTGYSALSAYFKHPFEHFFDLSVFWEKALSGEFMMHMLFFTAVVFLESVTSMRLARSQTDRESNTNFELFGLGVTNLILGCLGLLPVSIPVARNTLAYESGGNNKVYFLFSAILLFSFSFLLWPLMKHFPAVTVSAFNCCIGLMMIDFKRIISLGNHSPILIIPMTIILLGAMFIDILSAFSLALITFYLIYFNINTGYQYFKDEDLKTFFDKVLVSHQKNRIQESMMVVGNEERVLLNAMPKGLSMLEIDEQGEEQIEIIKDNFMEDGLIYSLLGTFNFFNYQMHFHNIKGFGKLNICLNFSEILQHDLDFFEQYKKLIKILDESGYDVFITGIPRQRMIHDISFKSVRWLTAKNNQGKLMYTD